MTPALPHPIGVPLYRQVKQSLTDRIARGIWRPGEQIPAEPRLAEELGVSPGTVRKALDEMAADRLVVRRQGSGTYVATASPATSLFRFFKLIDSTGARVMPSSRQLWRRVTTASASERKLLRLPPESQVIRFKRLRFTGEMPMMVETVVLVPDRMPGILEHRSELPNTLYDFYQERFGVTIRHADEILRAMAADEDTARLLGLPPESPILEIERLAYSFEDAPVELRLSRLCTANFAYLSRLE